MHIRFGISAKFAALVTLFLIGIVIVTMLTLNTLRRNLLADREVKTREIVEVAWSLVDHFAAMARSGAISEAQAKPQALEPLRYSGDGYIC